MGITLAVGKYPLAAPGVRQVSHPEIDMVIVMLPTLQGYCEGESPGAEDGSLREERLGISQEQQNDCDGEGK